MERSESSASSSRTPRPRRKPSSTSEELSGQAVQLQQTVSYFQLRRTSAPPRTTRSTVATRTPAPALTSGDGEADEDDFEKF